ncbi:MAG: DUF1844 domain-containing protein [Myxococcota bacterium]
MAHTGNEGEATGSDPGRELPPVTFSSFVVSLATSAMSHLGEGPGAQIDLPLAKHTIDLLGVLHDKSKGNLDDEEARLIEAVLYETRMKYLEHTRR